MNDKFLEFKASGCIFTGKEDVSLDDFLDAFLEFCECKGWGFCGIVSPLVRKYETNPEVFEPNILEFIKYSIEDKE